MPVENIERDPQGWPRRSAQPRAPIGSSLSDAIPVSPSMFRSTLWGHGFVERVNPLGERGLLQYQSCNGYMGILTPRRLAVPTGQNRGQLRAHPRMLRMSGARVNCRSLLPC